MTEREKDEFIVKLYHLLTKLDANQDLEEEIEEVRFLKKLLEELLNE